LYSDADGVAAGQVYPAQGALHLRQTGCDSAQDRGVRCNAVTDALDDAGKSRVGGRHDVDIRIHARMNVFELRLAEVGDHPPDPCIDKRENLLPDMGVSAFRNEEVGYPTIKWRVDAGMVVVVSGARDRCGASLALGHERIEGKHTRLGFAKLCRALFERGPGLRQCRPRGVEVGLGKSQLRFGLVHRLPAGSLCRARLVHLIDGNISLGQQRFDSVEVILSVSPFGFGSVQGSFRVGDVGFRLPNRGLRPLDIGGGVAGVSPGGVNGVDLSLNAPPFVDDLAFERGLVRGCMIEGIFVRSIIYFEEQIALGDTLIICNAQTQDRALDNRGDSNKLAKISASSVTGCWVVTW